MALGFGNDILDRLTQQQQLRQTAETQVGGSWSLSRLLDQYHTRYPWMDPTAKWSLAKTGIDPQSDTAQAAAQSAANLEVNNGLGFQPIGSPVTKPSTPPDTSNVFATLEGLRTQRSQPAPDPTKYAAPAPSALQQLAGDDWNKLQPNEQAELAKIRITQGQPGDENSVYPDMPAAARTADPNSSVYKVEGWDQLQPFWQQKVADILGKTVDAFMNINRDGHHSLTGRNGYFNDGYLVTNHETALAHPVTSYDVLAPLAPILRPAFMVSSAPLQELTGEFRNLYQLATEHTNPNWTESQSDLGVAIGKNGLNPLGWDAGTGVFVDPNSPVAQERQRRILERGRLRLKDLRGLRSRHGETDEHSEDQRQDRFHSNLPTL